MCIYKNTPTSPLCLDSNTDSWYYRPLSKRKTEEGTWSYFVFHKQERDPKQKHTEGGEWVRKQLQDWKKCSCPLIDAGEQKGEQREKQLKSQDVKEISLQTWWGEIREGKMCHYALFFLSWRWNRDFTYAVQQFYPSYLPILLPFSTPTTY